MQLAKLKPDVVWDLRWSFDFYQRPTINGAWTHSIISAWDKNKEGLLYARIEGKNRRTKEIKTFVRCAGQDFVNFQWIGMSNVGNPFKIGASKAPKTGLAGLKLISRNKEVTVNLAGKVFVSDRTTENINFATFGR